MDRSILKTGIPGAIVGSVLGFSLVFPAAASRGIGHGNDKEGYGHKCGYGQVKDNEEKEDRGENDKHEDKRDTDCNEDEDDDGGGGGDHGVLSQNQAGVVDVAIVGSRSGIGGSRLA